MVNRRLPREPSSSGGHNSRRIELVLTAVRCSTRSVDSGWRPKLKWWMKEVPAFHNKKNPWKLWFWWAAWLRLTQDILVMTTDDSFSALMMSRVCFSSVWIWLRGGETACLLLLLCAMGLLSPSSVLVVTCGFLRPHRATATSRRYHLIPEQKQICATCWKAPGSWGMRLSLRDLFAGAVLKDTEWTWYFFIFHSMSLIKKTKFLWIYISSFMDSGLRHLIYTEVKIIPFPTPAVSTLRGWGGGRGAMYIQSTCAAAGSVSCIQPTFWSVHHLL